MTIKAFKKFDETLINTKYTFFTGKGGVGKTSVACASAINLANNGKRVLLISTDPASNLQDVFGMNLSSKPTASPEYERLSLINLDPEKAAEAYRESVVGPYRGLLPDAALANMEEQLSGSCTTEIAAFNEFTGILTDESILEDYDHIIFDTAPTGHTLRMLQLPSAWNDFIEESTHGASCLGQLSGLEDDKDKYAKSVEVLCNPTMTQLILVTRPESTPLLEAQRASKELMEIGVVSQTLVINGLMETHDDPMSQSMYDKQQEALQAMDDHLQKLKVYGVALKSSSIYSSNDLKNLFKEDDSMNQKSESLNEEPQKLKTFVDHIEESGKRIVFMMGKGGVGKTTLATAVATELSKRNHKVILTTTDPANHIQYLAQANDNLSILEIDEAKELKKCQEEVLGKARETVGNADLDYIEEDLRSPCTQEIAVFRAFAEIVSKSDDAIVVIDTAPTGHTLLLLESTDSYDKEMKRSTKISDNAIANLLPKLRDASHTEVAIVSLAEGTPYHEAQRLEADLKRAGIYTKWWLINNTLVRYKVQTPFLVSKKNSEITWINTIMDKNQRNVAAIDWLSESIDTKNMEQLL